MMNNSKESFRYHFRFHHDMLLLDSFDKPFANYVLSNWLHMTRKWAIHAQAGLVHFGNTTNNRLESANRHLKRHTSSRDRLARAVHKVWEYSKVQLLDSAMKASYGSDRRLLTVVDSRVQNLMLRMTTYASKLLLHHVRRKKLNFDHDFIESSKVTNSFFQTSVPVYCS